MDTPLPVMRGRYCRRSRALNFAMRTTDTLLSVCRPLRTRGGVIEPPRRLLICNLAHLGDLVVATALLPTLKSAFPQCRIGFLIGSWARPVLEGHPLVDHIHVLDHWAYNRAALSKSEKFRQYRRTRRQALHTVKEAGYDTALDLCWSFPNSLPFLWQARISTRIGYGSGGFGPLTTHCLDFDERPLHVSERHLALLRPLGVEDAALAKAAPNLPPIGQQDEEALDQKMKAAGLHGDDYVICHVGAGGGLKVWPAARWRRLAERLTADGYRLAFTGTGERDAVLIGEITSGLPICVNLCDRLPWGEFLEAIARARLVVCVDTVAGHLAGALGTPCAVIMTGQNPYLWHPIGRTYQALTHPVPCQPCHRGLGCAGMECIRSLEVERVYQAGLELMVAEQDRHPLSSIPLHP